MRVNAKLNYLRMTPRKVRLVANLIRGMQVNDARMQLSYINKRAALPLLKLLNSAVGNAKHNFQLSEETLHISRLLVNEGPKLKRSRPRAMGRAFPILKRSSHIYLELESRGEVPKSRKQVEKKEDMSDKEVQDVPSGALSSDNVSTDFAPDENIPKEKKLYSRTAHREKTAKRTPSFVKKIFRRKVT